MRASTLTTALSSVPPAQYRFKAAGFKLVAASPKGGEAPLDPSSVEAFKDDEECKQFLNDKEAQEWVKNTRKLSDIKDTSEYSAYFAPGGHGPCFDLPVDSDNIRLIKEFYEAGKPTSSVCHGPAIFSDVKLANGDYLLKGRKVTSFTNEEEEQAGLTKAIPWLVETRLQERGATFEKSAPWQEKVIVDEDGQGKRLITGQNPASAAKLADAVIAAIREPIGHHDS